MMKEQQLPYLSYASQLHHIFPGTMPPASFLIGQFFSAVLGIVNQQVYPSHPLYDIRRELTNIMLVVGHVCNPSPFELEEIPQSSIGMGQPERGHEQTGVDFYGLLCLDLAKLYLRTKNRIHTDREIRSLHLSGKNLGKAELAFPLTINRELIFLGTSR